MGLVETDKDWSYGRVAFETYREHVGGRTYDDKPIPRWEHLSERQVEAWDLAATGVIQEYRGDENNEDVLDGWGW